MTSPPVDAESSASAWALQQVLGLIGGTDLGPGDRLPPERDLAGALGVSRGSVREATSALVAMGVLEARRGAGVFVTDLDPTTVLRRFAPVVALLDQRHPDGTLRLQALLQGAAAERAAQRATPEGLASLRQALTELRLAMGEPRSRTSEHRYNRTITQLSEDRFHSALAALADDPVAAGMLTLMRDAREASTPELSEVDLAAYERLLEALERGEPMEARSAAVLVASDSRARSLGRPAPTAAAPPVGRPAAATETAVVPPARDWFRDAKLGLIVHWGVYSVPGWAPLPPEHDDHPHLGEHAASRYFAEWYQASAAVAGSPTAQHHAEVHDDRPYQDFREPFEEALAHWSAERWAEQFASFGVRYVVQVAKHHDGYLLWPSRVRHPHDQTWRSPRDVVDELAGALRARGLRVGLSYSSGADWSFGDASVLRAADVRTSRPTGSDYARYVEAHWRELIGAYRPDGIWNDTGYPAEADAQVIMDEYRSAVPHGVVSARFRTSAPVPARPEAGGPWESLRPLGLSFGWNRQEPADLVTTGPELVCLLLDVVAADGNLLLGVSPDSSGRLPAAQEASLAFLGRWLDRFGAAVFGSRPWGPRTTTTTAGDQVWFTLVEGDLYVVVETTTPGAVEIEALPRLHEREVVQLDVGPARSTDLEHGTRLELDDPGSSPVSVFRVSPAPPDPGR